MNLSCLKSKECPLECNRTEIRTSVSMLSLSGYLYMDYINKNANLFSDFNSTSIDDLKAKESITKINIYYDSLTYEKSNESAKLTWIDLVSTIGGSLSLFMGISIFSFFELIELLIEAIFLKTKKINIGYFDNR